MESGQRIEAAGESHSQTNPISIKSEDVHYIPRENLSSPSSSSASDSSPDGSFEFTTNAASEFIDDTNDHLKNDEVYSADPKSEYNLASDDKETHHTVDLSNETKISSHSSPKSMLTESDILLLDDIPSSVIPSVTTRPVDVIVEPQEPDKDDDTEFIEADLSLTFPVFPSAHATTEASNSVMQPSPDFGEDVDIARTKDLQISPSASSSSSSDSESEILFQLGENATNRQITDNTCSPKFEKDPIGVSGSIDEDIPISSMPNNGQSPEVPTHRTELSSDSESATQYPPTQVMERPGDSTPSAYRIPSRVFTRTISTAPVEWSVASNESLFSIHMGNMSFTREQLCWLGKSGELCRAGEFGMSPLVDLASNQPLIIKPSDNCLNGTHSVGEPVVTEATAAETMRQVIRENSENKLLESSNLTERPSQSASLSHHSEGSTKSFQFPILADGGKSLSINADAEKPKQQKLPESPRQPSSNPQTPKEANAAQSSKLTPDMGPRRWLACFSCCPFCS